MKIILKSSGWTDILSLVNDKCDRTVDFGDDCQYAVLIPSYYEAAPIYCKTKKQAVKAYNVLYNNGYHNVTIIDRNAETYLADPTGELQSTDKLNSDHIEIINEQ